jgi:hypothetical protein
MKTSTHRMDAWERDLLRDLTHVFEQPHWAHVLSVDDVVDLATSLSLVATNLLAGVAPRLGIGERRPPLRLVPKGGRGT